MSTFDPGLAEVLAAETRLSHVDGEAGELVVGGYPLEVLTAHATFEEAVYLLWYGHLPTRTELAELQQQLAQLRELPSLTLDVLSHAAADGRPPIDALRMAAATFDLGVGEEMLAAAVLARMGTAAATYGRLRAGHAPVAAKPELGHAAHFLYLLEGVVPDAERARALEIYQMTVADHGLNASTFTARVITSTGSDLVSAVTGALGALKGPLHGGAPGPALEMVFEIGDAARAEEVLRAKLAQGERLMGFGHRVYKVRDPRADVLAAAASSLMAEGEQQELYRLAKAVEETALRVLAELKPGRRLDTNVEYYTALLLHGVGLEADMFTPLFAAGRTAGWIAHCHEQRTVGRIIRPQSRYIGEVHTAWTPIDAR
ncbi:MAG: citrate synthase [Litorilinea sp.]